MKLRIFPIFLVIAITMTGCAQQQLVIPPGEDRQMLESTIAQKGQSEPTSEVEQPRKNIIGTTLKAGVHVGKSCALIGLLAGYGIAKSKGGGSGSGSGPLDGVSLSEALKSIWSEDQ